MNRIVSSRQTAPWHGTFWAGVCVTVNYFEVHPPKQNRLGWGTLARLGTRYFFFFPNRPLMPFTTSVGFCFTLPNWLFSMPFMSGSNFGSEVVP